MTGPVGAVPGYNLAAPTEADAIAALERVFGRERGRVLWTSACRQAGLDVGKASTGSALERALKALAAQGGAAATVARSITIRMRTHTQLVARGGAASGARR
jgi:hypothetical protein